MDNKGKVIQMEKLKKSLGRRLLRDKLLECVKDLEIEICEGPVGYNKQDYTYNDILKAKRKFYLDFLASPDQIINLNKESKSVPFDELNILSDTDEEDFEI